MMDLRLQAETTGVTHFGAYNCPQDGHFYAGSARGPLEKYHVWMYTIGLNVVMVTETGQFLVYY